MKYAKIEEAIAAIARGDMVLVVDDEDRENEGDSDRCRREGHSGAHRLHGQTHERPDLPPDDRRAARSLEAAADGAGEHRLAQDRIHRLDRPGRRHHDRAFRRAIGRGRSGRPSTRRQRPSSSTVRVMCSHCATSLVECSFVRGIPKQPWTLRGSRALRRPACLCEVVNDDGSMSRGESLMSFAEEHQSRSSPSKTWSRIDGEKRLW